MQEDAGWLNDGHRIWHRIIVGNFKTHGDMDAPN